MHKRIQIPISENNDLLYISKTIVDEAFTTTKHSHPNLEILLFTDGEGKVIFDEKKISVKKNDILLINRETKHYEINVIGLSFYAIGINNYEVFMERFTDQFRRFSLTKDDAIQLKRIYDSIYYEAENKIDPYIEVIANYFNNLILILKRSHNLAFNKVPSVDESSIISSCKRLIENFYYEDFKIDDISKRLSVSKSYLCHKFKKETGMSIISYKLLVQLEEAKNLLTISDMSILEICDSIGFDSSSYFNKQFKKQYKITPNQFRKNEKSKKYQQGHISK